MAYTPGELQSGMPHTGSNLANECNLNLFSLYIHWTVIIYEGLIFYCLVVM